MEYRDNRGSKRAPKPHTKAALGKLEGKAAVITAATSGMALATAKLFVEEGAYVFFTGCRQDKLDEAVAAMGRNCTPRVPACRQAQRARTKDDR